LERLRRHYEVAEQNAGIRWTMSASHRGVSCDDQPNGRPVRFTARENLRIENGRIVACRDEMNNRTSPAHV